MDLGKKLSIFALLTGIPMFEVRSKLDHLKFGSLVGSIKVGSVRSKFGKDKVQTALADAELETYLRKCTLHQAMNMVFGEIQSL